MADAVVAHAGDHVVTVLDRFLAASISQKEFDAHIAAGRIVVAGERITDPATLAPLPIAIAIMLDRCDRRGAILRGVSDRLVSKNAGQSGSSGRSGATQLILLLWPILRLMA
jgi:hypothetical protein